MQAFSLVFLTVTCSVILIGALCYWLDQSASRRDHNGDS